jgi:hypothetical protein
MTSKKKPAANISYKFTELTFNKMTLNPRWRERPARERKVGTSF